MRRGGLRQLGIGRSASALALAIGLAAGLASPAAAQSLFGIDVERGSVRGWRVGLNHALGGCLASGTFRDRTTLWIGFERINNSAFVALTNPNWSAVEDGRTYRLSLTADGRRWDGDFVGVHRASDTGFLTTGLRAEFVVDFARAAGIIVRREGRELARLSLAGSSAAVTAVLGCQRELPGGGSAPERRADSEQAPQQPGRQAARAQPPPRREPGQVSTGTGFFVSDSGHVLTNAHVVRGCSAIAVRQPGAEPRRASLVAADAANDLALLRTDLEPRRVPRLALSTRVGEAVYVFGFPFAGTLTSSGNFTIGNITAAAGPDDNSRLFQHSAPIQPGNSGGPLIDQHGNVSGVVVATLSTDAALGRHIPQNVNFAIKAINVIAFLDAQGINRGETPDSTPLDPPTIAERAREFTVHVICR